MRETILKNLALSLVFTTFWTLFGFFYYYFEERDFLKGLSILIFYINSTWTAITIGIFAIILRFALRKKESAKLNLFYTLTGIFNLYFLLVWIILASLNLVRIESLLAGSVFASALISSFILYDLIRMLRQQTN
mgnify:CR=1 FL=1